MRPSARWLLFERAPWFVQSVSHAVKFPSKLIDGQIFYKSQGCSPQTLPPLPSSPSSSKPLSALNPSHSRKNRYVQLLEAGCWLKIPDRKRFRGCHVWPRGPVTTSFPLSQVSPVFGSVAPRLYWSPLVNPRKSAISPASVYTLSLRDITPRTIS